MKFRVYILINRERGSIYGIGTYIEQLVSCMNYSQIDFMVINLYSDTPEIYYTENNNTKQLFIPKISSGNIICIMLHMYSVALFLKMTVYVFFI